MKHPLLNEYRKRTEAATGADPRAWPALERRLFPRRRPARRFLIGGLATALTMAWLVGLAPRLTGPAMSTVSPSGAGGSEGSSGRAWGRGGTPGHSGT